MKDLSNKEIEERTIYRELLIQKLNSHELKISEAVKLSRKFLGLGQSDYAKKVGVSKLTIMNIENDRGNPTMKSVNLALSPFKLELQIFRRG